MFTLAAIKGALIMASAVLGAVQVLVKTMEGTVFVLPPKVATPIAKVLKAKPVIDKFIKFFGSDMDKAARTVWGMSKAVDPSTVKP